MSRILRQRGNEADPIIWICNETKNWVIPPLFLQILPITATAYDPVTHVRQITYSVACQLVENPLPAFVNVRLYNDATVYAVIGNNQPPTNVTFPQNQSRPVMGIEVWTTLGKRATQYDTPLARPF